jgi:ribosomal protein S18 acetylase RimI-like enzyme
MASGAVRAGIDAAWLERAARSAPMDHAYPLWDLVQAPDRTRFVSVVRDGATTAYLLLWLGSPNGPIAHWVGAPDLALYPSLPPAPSILLVPPEVAPRVLADRPGCLGFPTTVMLRHRDVPLPADPPGVRRLTRRDQGLLPHVLPPDEPMAPEYARLDPDVQPVWGAFDGEELVAVARVSVSLPFVWVIAGVYTRPEHRNRGLGRAVTGAVARHAEAMGASAGLFVRDQNVPARRAYERLGFRPVGHKVWFEPARSAPRPADRGFFLPTDVAGA